MSALGATVRAALAEAWANRRGFWTQVGAMIVNDIVWVVFWLLFFHKVGTLRGWDSHRVLLLLAVLTTSAGFVLGVLGNSRRIGRLAADGELDAVLALPVPTLAYLLVRRIETTNLGDLAFGIVLFGVTGHPTPERTAIYLGASALAVVLLTGFLVVAGSTAFFVGRNEGGELGFQAMLMFAMYPVDIFTGPARALLYTVIPAAFIGAVPARLLTSWDPSVALGALAAATIFAVGAWSMFRIGLRRYTSGSVWTHA
jgi:ABC-2 type transport system permease protein